ncbi:hypothetical protein COV24_00995 [candidate division WWE3 bacterium CG10_big_fil_rev_8_21_14_0_10_32_10]|uniref:Dockerin domain-containing protein n=1 Tax=candidate division WWE3 bacterium CG10_big_fil_rev_8_21_14_0_10_32_10 TaxID=1975090 RepID=A0A2H0RB89_UNCKA|nr:MAG: hypothetical protein COV24_00995 [candidate division WWE3 bacterium CG10_big_fil_rev_8_21_14_0_10_32_10]
MESSPSLSSFVSILAVLLIVGSVPLALSAFRVTNNFKYDSTKQYAVLDTYTIDTSTTNKISNIVDNKGNYADNEIPKYEKYEITFDVSTHASNKQFPYDPSPPTGIDLANPHYDGITVNAVFKDPDGSEFTQPAFYYQVFEENTATDWYYPTTTYQWKARFAPNKIGTWQFKLAAQDKDTRDSSGNLIWEGTDWQSFNVVANTNTATDTYKGFLKVSNRDPRYFEFDNGDYFPGLGYNENYSGIQWVKPVQGNTAKLKAMGDNGIQYARIWLSEWGIYGAEWTPWKYFTGNGYLQKHILSIDTVAPESEISQYIDVTQTPSSACMFNNWESAEPAIRKNTAYRIQVRYKSEGITGPAHPEVSSSYGFVIKTGGWLWRDLYDNDEDGVIDNPQDEQYRCYWPGTGTIRSDYITVDSGGWQMLTGTYSAGTRSTMDRLFFVIENATAGRVYIDYISIQEDLGNGQYGANIIEKPNFNQHLYFDERNAYAFDKVLDLAKQNNVYFRPVIMEKNDWIFNRIQADGTFGSYDTENKGFYGDFRNNNTKLRWLQRAWWRYLQARWGYSTNIHSWELLNEGDPDIYNFNLSKVGRHQMLADEMGKYMHCDMYGVTAGTSASQYQCPTDYNHPNDHLVSTSHWHSFPWNFWANKHSKYVDPVSPDDAWSFFNVDFADIHLYSNSTDMAQSTFNSSQSYFNQMGNGTRKPVIMGENGQDAATVENDTSGTWVHNLAWGQINPYGLYDAGYWWVNRDLYGASGDHRKEFKPYYDFIKTVPLSNGYYEDIAATSSNTNLRAWGQKDVVNGNAHVWIQNKNHTWKNVVDGVAINPESDTITLGGFAPDNQYQIEWWDTYTGQITNVKDQMSNASGDIVLTSADNPELQNITTDVAVKIINPNPPAQVLGDLNGDHTVNIQDIIILINEIFTPSGVQGSDINSDGKVDILDVIQLINIIFS